MINKPLKPRIEDLTENDLSLVKVLIFHYNNLKAEDEIKVGYRLALHHVFHMLNIASIPNIDLRPAAEQQIEKIIKTIVEIEQ